MIEALFLAAVLVFVSSEILASITDDDCPHQMRDGRCEWCGKTTKEK